MSYIAFESAAGRVEIGGCERARMGVLLDDLAWVMHSRGAEWRTLENSYGEKVKWTHGSGDNFSERLGYACLIGDDCLKLLAHIHGQCEINGWLDPSDGEWFAGLVEEAYGRGLLGDDIRNNYGSWPQVADLARVGERMVSSYSVTESWPDPHLIAQYRPDLWKQDEDGERWYELSQEERDRIADEALPACCPRWQPSEWGIWANEVRDRRPWSE